MGRDIDDERAPRDRSQVGNDEAEARQARGAPGKVTRTSRLAPAARTAGTRSGAGEASVSGAGEASVRPAHAWLDDPRILAAHGFAASEPDDVAASAHDAGAQRPAQRPIEEAGPHRRVVGVTAGELLVIHAASGQAPVTVTVTSRAGAVLAVQTGTAPRIELIAEHDDELLVTLAPAGQQPILASPATLASGQLMVTRQPPGAAASTAEDGAALLSARQHLLANLFGLNPGALHPDTGLQLAEALDRLELLARQAASGDSEPGALPASLDDHALHVTTAHEGHIEQVAYELAGPAARLHLETRFDSATGALQCRLTFAAADGTALSGMLAHHVALVDGMPVGPAADPLGAYLGSAPGTTAGALDDFGDLTGDAGPTPARAGSAEGLGSFVEGALAGDLGDNDSWSALAGQTGMGFVPIAGQVADARDIGAAGADVWQGEPGAWVMLGISVIAIIPGLDFLKGGSRAGRRALSEAAVEAGQGVPRAGLKRAAKVLSKEAAARAARELQALAVARQELLARWQVLLVDEGLSPKARALLRRGRNSLQDHLTPGDLAGALRDKLGVPVRMSGSGKAWDHLGEVDSVIKSLTNLHEAFVDELGKLAPGSDAFRRLAHETDALRETRTRIGTFLEIR